MTTEKITALTELETAAFCDQLALILGSGVSAYEGITVMLEEADSQSERSILNMILEELKQSGQLHQALAVTGAFPSYMLNMTAIGEESGKLDEVMAQLARHYEREAELRNGIRNTITYPAVMTLLLAAIVALLLTQVLPVFQQIFRQMGTELTGVSGGLMKAGSALGTGSMILLAVLLVLSIAGLFLSRSETGRSKLIGIAAKIPAIRRLYDNIAACRFADGMAIALSSGLTPDRSMELAASLINDEAFGKKIEDSRKAVEEGADITDALRDNGVLTGVYSRIAGIGYKTGNMEHSMARIAELYQEDIDNRINNLLATLEPTLIIILSLIVGIVLLTVMMPLLGILAGI